MEKKGREGDGQGRGQAGKGTVKNKTREAQRMGSISRSRDAADKSKRRTTTGGVSPRAPARSATPRSLLEGSISCSAETGNISGRNRTPE